MSSLFGPATYPPPAPTPTPAPASDVQEYLRAVQGLEGWDLPDGPLGEVLRAATDLWVLAGRPTAPVPEGAEQDLAAFRDWLLDKGRTPGSVQATTSSVRVLLRTAKAAGARPEDIATGVAASNYRRYQEFRGETPMPTARRGRPPKLDLEAFRAFLVWDRFSKSTMGAVCAEVRRERYKPDTWKPSHAKDAYLRWQRYVRKSREANANGENPPGPWLMADFVEVPA